MLALLQTSEAWAALFALLTMGVVLNVDNLVFISIVTNKLPEKRRALARRLGISMALGLRLVFLGALVWVTELTHTVYDLDIGGKVGDQGIPNFETAFSWRDIILIVGGVYLLWKATTEIHNKVESNTNRKITVHQKSSQLVSVVVQIVAIETLFSFDSLFTAVGITDSFPIMATAAVISSGILYFASGPSARFIDRNPTVVMIALAFLLLIGMVLVSDGLGRQIPKGYIYGAMAFAVFVETLNMLARRKSRPFRTSKSNRNK
jgi:predicted tellurium resistance membrane protein TerC